MRFPEAELIGPANVEVAEDVATILPNCPTPPWTYEPANPADEETPPANVVVAVEVEVMTPVVSEPMLAEPEVRLEKDDDRERKMLEKSVVEVAFVERRFGKVEVAVEVAVKNGAVTDE